MGKKKTTVTTTEGIETETTTEMAEKLVAAGKQAEEAKAARRERTVKGSHLLEALIQRATTAGFVITDKSGFIKISGSTKGRKVYVARKGGRVDGSGFAVEHAALLPVSEEEAREKHIGKVRCQIDFDQDDASVLSAYDALLAALNEQVTTEAAQTVAA